ncbi:MAG: hypothetical protein R3B06_23800 [Kofleriaceae bacterium]
MTRVVAAAAAVLLCAPVAASAEVTIVKGGPSAAGRGLAEGALGEAARAMAVCWRAPTTGPVRVAVAVGKDGAVTASAVTRGPAAQCAAGILAVWTIGGGPWKGEVDVGVGEPAAPDLATAIQQQLLAASGPIKACQAQAPGKAGPAQIKMKISPDGSIGGIVVASKLGAGLDGCVARAVAAIRLKPTGAIGAVNYQLAVAFSGAAVAAAPPAGGGATAAPAAQGSVSGPLAPGQLEASVAAARAKLVACGKGKATGSQAVVRFTVRADGTVKNVVLKTPSGVGAVDTCLQQVVGTLTFPATTGESKVVLPVGF